MNRDTNLNLFEEGLRSYVDALGAMKEFYREAYSRSRKVLDANLDDLGRNFRRRLERDSVALYVSPAGTNLDAWDGTRAWVAAKLPVRDLCDGYFGVCWRVDDGEPPRPGAVVDFDFWRLQRPLFITLSQHLRSFAGEKILLPSGKQVMIWEAVDPVNAGSFADTLDSITKEWIALLGRIPSEAFPVPPMDL
jgi:hypothetical protein